jgi:3'(2'), 5'-bisphosphate nucleotidase
MVNEMISDIYVTTALRAAVLAGRAIMDVYRTDFTVEHKSDDSPLTLADRLSHDLITKYLRPLGIPILSEEGKSISHSERSTWDTLWIVDPLDGTKEFVKRNDEFTVNIALVRNQVPELGVIFVPVQSSLYFGCPDRGAYLLEDARLLARLCDSVQGTDTAPDLNEIITKSRRLPITQPGSTPYVIVGSRSHATPELEAFVEEQKTRYEQVEFVSAGSSLKFCLVAEGKAAIYPRLGPTMEWDTAAGHAIAVSSGAKIYRHDTGGPLLYNRENLLNPWFVVEFQEAK